MNIQEKDIFEESIRQHREDFEKDMPSGHAKRFLAKLEINNPKQIKRKTFNGARYGQIAAALVIGFMLATIIDKPQSNTLLPESKTNNNNEITEVKAYYTSSIEAGEHKLKHFADIGVLSKEEQEMLQQEYKEFQSNYKMLMHDLNSSPNEARVIQAMVKLYKTRLEVIEMIIHELELIQNKKIHTHEHKI